MKFINLFKRVNENFSVKSFIKITLFIVMITFSFTIFFVLQQSKSQTDNLIKKGELLAKLLAYNSKLGVFTENENLLMNSTRGFLQYDEVLSVSIFNLEGKLLIKQETPGREIQAERVETDKNKKEIIEKIKKSGAFFYRESYPDMFEFWMPVITGLTYPDEDAFLYDKNLFPKKDRIIGFVEVILDESILNKQLKALLFKGILIGIIFSMAGAVATYFMVKRITNPIKKLSNASVEIGKGNLEVKVEIASKDEIGRLAASFNTMVQDLKEYRTERKCVEEALQESQKKYRAIFETTGTAMSILEEDTIISLANTEYQELTGYSKDELEGKKSWTEFVVKEDREKMKEYHRLRRIAPDAAPRNYEFRLIDRQGHVKDIFATIAMIPGTKKSVASLLDITEHKNAEKELLRKKEEKIDFLAEILKTSSVSVIVTDQDEKITYVNPATEKLYGYRAEELIGKGPGMFNAGPKAEEVQKKIVNTIRQGEVWRGEILQKNKNGDLFYIQASVYQLLDREGNFIALIGFQEDITERKQVEEKLIVYQDQLRSMASELSLTEERERRRIAADLHDHIGQSLAISKIQLGALRKVLFSSELARSIDKIYELITQTIQDTRSLIFELSPPILYELGIEAAVEWLAEQIKEQHNIMVEFEDDNQSKPLDDDIRVLLFQAVRELLVNVVKHSQARKVKVSVQKDGGNIRIHVEDNGIGFDSSKIYSYSDRTRGFGLFSIRERLDYLGGYFTIASEPGYGTQVTLGAPLKNNEESIKGKLHEHKDSLS